MRPKHVTFALLGCGKISARYIDALSSKVAGARIAAVCDVDAERAAVLGRQLGVPAFSAPSDLYSRTDVDVIAILTPSGDHYERVREALAAGKHVVVEKPLCLRLDQAREIVDEARDHRLNVWVAFQNRFNPAVRKTRAVVKSGRLGRMVLGTIRLRWARDQAYYGSEGWRGTWRHDGGVAAQQAIHHIDVLHSLLGQIIDVEALLATRLANIEVEDVCVATLRFASGALGVIEATTAARPRDFEASISLLAEGGTIVLGGIAMNEIITWEFVEPNSEDRDVPRRYSQQVPNAIGFGHDALLQNVVDVLVSGAEMENSAESTLGSLELLHAIYRSAELGRRVTLAEGAVSERLGVGPSDLGLS